MLLDFLAIMMAPNQDDMPSIESKLGRLSAEVNYVGQRVEKVEERMDSWDDASVIRHAENNRLMREMVESLGFLRGQLAARGLATPAPDKGDGETGLVQWSVLKILVVAAIGAGSMAVTVTLWILKIAGKL